MNCQMAKTFFRISVYLILWLTICLLLPALFFFMNVPVKWWMLPLSAAIAGVLYTVWFRERDGIDWRGILLGAAIISLAVLLAFLIFTIHWDGNTYHKTAVGLMTDGWNPIDPDCTAVLENDKITEGMRYNAQWVNHYANGGWILSAVFASFFRNIETGKAVNLLFMAAVFGILFRYLSMKRLRIRWCAVIAGLAVFQPVTVSQMESFYIDGNLYLFLLLSVIAMLMLSDCRCEIKKRYPLLFLFAGIVWCINLKFTGMAYIGFFCIGFYLCWLVFGWKEGQFLQVFFKATLLFTGIAAFAILVVGYSSYVCNFQETGNPLYPLIGSDKIDIMEYSEPNTFAEKSNPEKSMISLFGKTENVTNTSKNVPALKIPFTFSIAEIKSCMYTDNRIGGQGPWFSGIFLIAAALSVWLIKSYYSKEKILLTEWAVTLGIALLLLFFMPGSWWARYSAYIWFFVLSAMVFLALKAEEQKEAGRSTKAGAMLVLTAISLNTACFLLAPAAGIVLSPGIRKDMEDMRQAAEIGEIEVYCKSHMTGILWNLDDWKISYRVSEGKIKGNRAYNDKIIWK